MKQGKVYRYAALLLLLTASGGSASGFVQATEKNVSESAAMQQDSPQVDPNSNYIVTKDNDKQQFDQTIKYLQDNKIEIKSAIPEVGFIETKKTSENEVKKIEENTPTVVKKTKKENESYKPTTLDTKPAMKPFWNEQWNMQKLTHDYSNVHNEKTKDIKIGVIDSGINENYR